MEDSKGGKWIWRDCLEHIDFPVSKINFYYEVVSGINDDKRSCKAKDLAWSLGVRVIQEDKFCIISLWAWSCEHLLDIIRAIISCKIICVIRGKQIEIADIVLSKRLVYTIILSVVKLWRKIPSLPKEDFVIECTDRWVLGIKIFNGTIHLDIWEFFLNGIIEVQRKLCIFSHQSPHFGISTIKMLRVLVNIIKICGVLINNFEVESVRSFIFIDKLELIRPLERTVVIMAFNCCVLVSYGINECLCFG